MKPQDMPISDWIDQEPRKARTYFLGVQRELDSRGGEIQALPPGDARDRAEKRLRRLQKIVRRYLEDCGERIAEQSE